MSQHIKHIRQNGQLRGTLVALKDEAVNAVRVGFSLVRPGDNPCKSVGVEIATQRALKRKSTKVPNLIRQEFTEFLEKIPTYRRFEGAHCPKVEDFQFSHEPLNTHNYGK